MYFRSGKGRSFSARFLFLDATFWIFLTGSHGCRAASSRFWGCQVKGFVTNSSHVRRWPPGVVFRCSLRLLQEICPGPQALLVEARLAPLRNMASVFSFGVSRALPAAPFQALPCETEVKVSVFLLFTEGRFFIRLCFVLLSLVDIYFVELASAIVVHLITGIESGDDVQGQVSWLHHSEGDLRTSLG